MNFYVMTLFPEMIEQAMHISIIGRALKSGLIALETANIRDFAQNKHHRVDDYPYGGGAGMVMQAEPVYLCYQSLAARCKKGTRVIYLSPQGRVFDQALAKELVVEEELIFLCGHYEGVDERVVEEIVTDEISVGDYVLTGGELPALVVMDAVARLIPGVLNNQLSALTESFSDALLEYPQYTRPEEWRGKFVPEVLLSGNHAKQREWYRKQSLFRTAKNRPDLLNSAELSDEEREWVRRVAKGEAKDEE